MESKLVNSSKDEFLITSTASVALQLRWERELAKLTQSQHDNLRRDMQKLYEEKSFSNVVFILKNDSRLESHSAVLKARAPTFYKFCKEARRISRADPDILTFHLPEVNESHLSSFLREVYCGGSMEEPENEIIQLLSEEFNESEAEIQRVNKEILVNLEPDAEDESEKCQLSLKDSGLGFDKEGAESSSSLQCHDYVNNLGATTSQSLTQTQITENLITFDDFESLNSDRISLLDSTKLNASVSDTKSLDSSLVCVPTPSDFAESSFSALLSSTGGPEVLMGSSQITQMIDSGMCSESRKLSTCSSVGPDQQIITSEDSNKESSNESLPKDDSLECCLDSLANDDLHETSTSAFSSFNIGDSFPKSIDVTRMSSSCPSTAGVLLSSWVNVGSKKYSWGATGIGLGELEEAGNSSQRRWSVCSNDSSVNNGSKPAAIVLPYNASADLLQVEPPSSSTAAEQPPTVNLGAVSVVIESSESASGDRNSRCPPTSSTVKFVPFLREAHHIQGQSQESAPETLSTSLPPNPVPQDASILEVQISEGEQHTPVDPTNPTPQTTADVPPPPQQQEVRVEAHPPVYMYIEASECQSPLPPRPKSAAGRPHHSDVPLRRKVLGSATTNKSSRPKSETAASLFFSSPKDARRKMADKKRISLTFGDDDAESVKSLEGVGVGIINRPKGSYGSKLGDDLLKMFTSEIDSDVKVIVNEKEIKAHKSVLSSRCIYFAAAMSGNWIESAGNVITINGFSYESVHFAIYHIYSGASVVPENIDISELASLADMLGLEGLKDVVSLAMKMKYCHFFHKPCAGCSITVSECLLIAASFGLDELQEKCLRWISKHMLKTWPTKSFAALPEELLIKCLNASKIDISTQTVLDMSVRCEKLSSTLPRVKWMEPVAALAQQLSETCALFLAENLAEVIASTSFQELRTGHTWSIHALEPSLLTAAENSSLNGACKSYVNLHALRCISDSPILSDDSAEVNENFEVLVSKLHRQVEHFLIHNANRVVRCTGWALLAPQLQQRIKDAAVIVFEFGKPTAAPPKLSSQNKKFTRVRTTSSSATSGSPVVRNGSSRVGVNSQALSKSLQLTLEERSHRKAKSDRAATLPRTTDKLSSSGNNNVNRSTKITSTCKQPSASNNNTNTSSNVMKAAVVTQAGDTAAQRPKTLNLKERSCSLSASKSRDKAVSRDATKSLIPNSIALRSATGTSSATASKYAFSHRPKPVSGGTTFARPLRVTSNGSESHGKENKNGTKNGTLSHRPTSAESGLKRASIQRSSINRNDSLKVQ